MWRERNCTSLEFPALSPSAALAPICCLKPEHYGDAAHDYRELVEDS